MQVIALRTNSPRINANLLEGDFSGLSRNFKRNTSFTRLQPFFNFRGEISSGDISFSTQNFSLREEKNEIHIQNYPINSFPKIDIVLEKKGLAVQVKEFKIQPSDDSVRGEILYTRLFLIIADYKKRFSIFIKGIDSPPLNFTFSELPLKERKEAFYRAKLFRKLGFIEKIFNTKFIVPKDILPVDAQQIEVLFRGITEGEFTTPTDSLLTIFNYKVSKSDLQNNSLFSKRAFSFEFDEDLFVLGKLFPVGKMFFKIDKASISNPRIIQNVTEGSIVPHLQLNVFDSMVYHRFEKYTNPGKFLRNKQKFEQFKNDLRKEEPHFFISLISEPLAEITDNAAIEIVEGLLQYHDFPDRFSTQKPTLQKNRWRVPISLTYPRHKPIWLEDIFVDVRTGEVKLKGSFENLLKKGKLKAKETFSLE